MRRHLARQRTRNARPELENLEGRQLLTASLGSIADLSVPSQQGYVQALDGSGTTDPQTFAITRTSGSADIAATVPQGAFWTINVGYTDPSVSANSFTGTMVFQLFPGLTPNTVSEIETFTNDGYYTGKNFTRIASGFSGPSNYIVQGGASAASPNASSGQPGTPFLNENVQQLAFTGTNQLAMANAGAISSLPGYGQGVNSNDSQFFVTSNASPNAGLGYGYTIFGQLVSGQATLSQITQVPVHANSSGGEVSVPNNPVVMSSLSLSSTNPNGVALIDTTQAKPGDSATFQVTATDSVDHTTTTRSFTVTVGAYSGPTDPAIDFKPFASPVAATVAEGASTSVALAGQAGFPDPAALPYETLSYQIVTPPAHGTVTNLNTATGQFVYTPQAGYSGPDSLQFQVQDTGPWIPQNSQSYNGSPITTTSNPAIVTFTVTPTPTPTSPSPTPTSPSPTPTPTSPSPTPTPTSPTPTPTPTSPSPTPTPTSPTPTPPPSLVTLLGIVDVMNKRHQVTKVELTFSGALDAAGADGLANFQLIKRGKRGTFVASGGSLIAIASASYDPAHNMVTLIPRKPFVPTKPVEVVVLGGSPAGLHDSVGRLIDGNRDGQAGGNATGILTKRGASL